ncbi:MAG: hypothetical protein V1837_03295 [Candidatus Woesearchaeota archaeon]
MRAITATIVVIVLLSAALAGCKQEVWRSQSEPRPVENPLTGTPEPQPTESSPLGASIAEMNETGLNDPGLQNIDEQLSQIDW